MASLIPLWIVARGQFQGLRGAVRFLKTRVAPLERVPHIPKR